MNRKILVAGAAAVVILAAGTYCVSLFDGDPPEAPLSVVADAEAELEQTRVAVSLDVPHEAGKNLLWCATLQLAWDELAGRHCRRSDPPAGRRTRGGGAQPAPRLQARP